METVVIISWSDMVRCVMWFSLTLNVVLAVMLIRDEGWRLRRWWADKRSSDSSTNVKVHTPLSAGADDETEVKP